MNGPVELDIDAAGTATITLDRPEIHNAFDDAMIGTLNDVIAGIAVNPAVRVVVIEGRGRSFSTGADLNWMRRSATYSPAENLTDAMALARLMSTLDALPMPTMALVRGAAFGGGVGLAACCDIVIAADDARFSFSEVRLGLIPAVIGPYVIAAIGAHQARRYFLTGEMFSASIAQRIGLVHQVVPADALHETRDELLADLHRGGPQAQAEAKALIAMIARNSGEPSLPGETARLISERRASDEGREGLAAFLEKRLPAWRTA